MPRRAPNAPHGKVFPRGLNDEFPDGPPTVVIKNGGCVLALRFAVGDIYGKGALRELCVFPASGEELLPRELREIAPNAELYLALARSAMRAPFDEESGTPEERWENLRSATEALRQVAGPGRGHPPEFYEMIAWEHAALVEGGEKHPVKALSEKHYVTISAASRWVTKARRRGLIPEKKKGGTRAG